MKKLLLPALAGLCVFVAFGGGRVGATTVQYTQKTIVVNFTVTPSPVAFTPAHPPTAAVAVAAAEHAPERPAGASPRILPLVPTLIGAGAGVGIGLPSPEIVAATQGNVPVTINVQADPTATYLHIVPKTPNMNAAYGLNNYSCAFQVYAYYTTTWRVTDWVQSGNGGFPTYGYPTTSQLSWYAETISTAYTAFANSGSPGQLTWNGVAKVAQTVCMDLKLNVPNSIAAGTYAAPLLYTLVVTL